MSEISEEEKIGFAEALDWYNLVEEEDRKKIPEEFVTNMKKYAKKELVGRYKTNEEIIENKISREGTKKISYMSLFI